MTPAAEAAAPVEAIGEDLEVEASTVAARSWICYGRSVAYGLGCAVKFGRRCLLYP